MSALIFLFLVGGANCLSLYQPPPPLHKGLESVLERDSEIPDHILKNGLDPDPIPSYNNSNHEPYPSAPGCPSATDGYPWVLYGSPPKCFIAGIQGPCHHTMKMTYHSSTTPGTCECKCASNDPSARTNSYCDLVTEYGFQGTFAKYEPAKQCYELCEQGPCRFDEWLTMDSKESKAICERIPPRDEHSSPATFYSIKRRSCQYKAKTEDFEGGLVGLVNPDNCEDHERYSKFLKRCLVPFLQEKDSHRSGELLT